MKKIEFLCLNFLCHLFCNIFDQQRLLFSITSFQSNFIFIKSVLKYLRWTLIFRFLHESMLWIMHEFKETDYIVYGFPCIIIFNVVEEKSILLTNLLSLWLVPVTRSYTIDLKILSKFILNKLEIRIIFAKSEQCNKNDWSHIQAEFIFSYWK